MCMSASAIKSSILTGLGKSNGAETQYPKLSQNVMAGT